MNSLVGLLTDIASPFYPKGEANWWTAAIILKARLNSAAISLGNSKEICSFQARTTNQSTINIFYR